MEKTAIISGCGKYRYHLSRKWDDGPNCLFIMLNPSTADARADDPTIRRCIKYAKDWGCGSLAVVNLFAFRATSPKDMKAAEDPIGDENLRHIKLAAGLADMVVCAWGAHGDWMNVGLMAVTMLECEGIKPLALAVTKGGEPRHPLYLKADLKPFPLKELIDAN